MTSAMGRRKRKTGISYSEDEYYRNIMAVHAASTKKTQRRAKKRRLPKLFKLPAMQVRPLDANTMSCAMCCFVLNVNNVLYRSGNSSIKNG